MGPGVVGRTRIARVGLWRAWDTVFCGQTIARALCAELIRHNRRELTSQCGCCQVEERLALGVHVFRVWLLHTLADIAGANGMKREGVLKALASEQDKNEVLAETTQAQQIGVTGVPTYILNRKYGVVGAQGAEMLAEQIRKAASEI